MKRIIKFTKRNLFCFITFIMVISSSFVALGDGLYSYDEQCNITVADEAGIMPMYYTDKNYDAE